jgi:Tol biopolymer transport system component
MRPTARRFLVSLLLACSAVALFAPSAAAKPAEIAYRCDVDICLIDPDNPAAIVNLTNNGSKTFDEEPVWSPTGDRVAFVSQEKGFTNIFVMNPDAPGQTVNVATQVTHYVESSSIYELTWSPDGTRLAYERDQGGFRQIFLVAADGSTLTPLSIAAPGEHPTFSPDGGKIAFSKGAEQVWTTNADGSNAIAPVTNALGHDPTWSPDGTFIAYDHKNAQFGGWFDVNVANLAGGTPAVLPANFAQWTLATWSPDGARLAYRSTVRDAVTMEDEGFIRIANRDGSGNVALPARSGVDIEFYDPSWSPDGSRITFMGLGEPPQPRALEVYVQSTGGAGQMQAITSGGGNSEPDWRPDPLRTPFVPVVTPSQGSAGQPPGGRKPQLVWFTKRIPISGGGPVHMMIVFCGAPDCGASARATAPKSAAPAGLRFRPATSSKAKPKPKRIAVGSGELKLREGEEKPLLLYLNKAGKALLKEKGKLDFQATVTVTSTGQAPVTSQKTIHVVLKKPKKTGKSG